MKLIAAVDKNWGIGLKGKLLCSIPEDMKYFRNTTLGNVVVMGRRTLESLPGGRALPDRTNIVLTKNPDYRAKGAAVVHSVEELQKELEQYDTESVFVIGGMSIYKTLYSLCDTAYITKIDYAYEADAYFPDLDQDDKWKLSGESDEYTYFDLSYTFCTYRQDLQ